MIKCPVCQSEVHKPVPPFCSRCSWDLKNDLTMGTFLDLPDAVIEEYRQRVGIAVKNWNEKAELLKKQAELEEKLRRMEAERKQKKVAESAPEPEAPKAAGKPASKPSSAEYSEKTAVPLLKRDPFETLAEFEKRINEYPPVPAGMAELMKDEYDIQSGKFPLRVKWAEWMIKELPDSLQKNDNLHVLAERDKARRIYEAGAKHCLFVCLKAFGERVSAEKPEISVRNRILSVVSNLAPKVWKEPVSGMEFVYIPAGILEEKWLKGFYMSKFPVTQGQWKEIIGSNPSHFQKGDDYPVESVSWNDTKEFIRKLNEKNQGSYKFRLPMEAEWEYAARAGSDRVWCFGDDESLLEQYAWYKKNSGGSTHPVGQLKPNAWGLYDMHGNVWEWCEDAEGAGRVLRGGSWYIGADDCRSVIRNWNDPGGRLSNLGFRVLAVPAQGRAR